MKCLFFDTETNGLYRKGKPFSEQPYILQLSWLIIENNSYVLKDYYIKIPDNVEIPKEASNIHGITKEYLNENGVNIKIALNEFLKDTKNLDYIVAHNIYFDENMINLELARLNSYDNIIDNVIPNKCKKYCTMKNGTNVTNIIKENSYGKYFKYPKLNELYKKIFENEEVDNYHNSKVDIICSSRCFYKMNKEFDIDIFQKIPNLKNEI
jgi:DNA polymerase-3 subunit epsilon